MMQESSSAGSRTVVVHGRTHWVAPADLMARLELDEGMRVAEVGAGCGAYAIPLGLRVGARGRVFAVESRPGLLAELRTAVHGPGAPPNVMTVEGTPEETHIPDHCCDLVVMADVLHELSDESRAAALREAKRILSDDGRLAILEWRHDATSAEAPPAAQRVAFDKAVCLVELNSWSLERVEQIDPNGYLLTMRPTDESVQT